MVAVLISLSDEAATRRAKYVIDQLFRTMRLPYRYVSTSSQIQGEETALLYGHHADFGKIENGQERVVCIPHYDYLRQASGGTRDTLPQLSSTVLHCGRTIPIYYDCVELRHGRPIANYKSGGMAVGVDGCRILFGFDIIMSAFHLLSCQEEYLIDRRDKFGRFLASYSPRFNTGTLKDPIVNYYVALLSECVDHAMGITVDCRSAPERLKVCLSHDVDNLWSRQRWVLAHNIERGVRAAVRLRGDGLAREIRALAHKVVAHDTAYWSFGKYMELERKYGARSTFHFICGRRGRYGARYRLESLGGTLDELREGGWKIGLHTNFYSYDSSAAIREEKELLEAFAKVEVVGARNHYLMFRCPDSWAHLQDAGLLYDCSLGYADDVGFRAGIASPFNPYDLLHDRAYRILEIPLVAMDKVIFDNLGLSNAAALNLLSSTADKLARVGGCLTILWHSCSLDDLDRKGAGRLYEQALDMLTGKGAEFVTEQDLMDRYGPLAL